jgi:preprotein translocase subunit YajC
MSFFISAAQAAGAAGAAGAGKAAGGGFGFTIIMMVGLFALMYFMMIRPQMKRQKEHRAMVSALGKGDEVVTNGGLAGRIDELGESFVMVEISAGVKVKIQRGAIAQVLPKGTLKAV